MTTNITLEENTTTTIPTPEELMKNRFRGFLPVVIDVETAGFNPKTDALLEVAAVTLKFNEEGLLVKDQSFHFNIEPFEGANLEEANLKFLGIDVTNPLRGAVTEKTALIPLFKDISKLVKANGCKRAVLVGHNAHFDHSFIMAATERLNYKRSPFHPFSVLDTSTLSSVFLGQSVLSVACQTIGLEFDNSQAHSALYDTEMTADLFCYFINRLQELKHWPLALDMQERAELASQNKDRYHTNHSSETNTETTVAETTESTSVVTEEMND